MSKREPDLYLQDILDSIAKIEIPWEKMVSMRNKVLHEYFGGQIKSLTEISSR